MKKPLKIIGSILLLLILAVGGLFLYLTVREYRPESIEKTPIDGNGTDTIKEGETVTVLTWNIGYGALNKNDDFFMDGGKKVRPDSKQIIEEDMTGIGETIALQNAEVVFLQEVDRDSKRSYGFDEAKYLADQNEDKTWAYAPNFRVDYIPYPLPTIGKVEGGLVTLNSFSTSENATRIALPTSFKWPVRIGQLKRCLLVERVPIKGSTKEMVLVNLHLEAYDDGSGKEAQTKVLFDFLEKEYKKGNYCIAGGDFNQTFDNVDMTAYPLKDTEYFTPGSIDSSGLGTEWSFVMDNETPTSRLLNEPFDPESEDTQYYMIDGFIVSPNVDVDSVETIDEGFAYTDHNPVKLTVSLRKGK